MKYLLMIYGNQEKWASIPAEAIARQNAFNRRYQETGELIGVYGLADAAAARSSPPWCAGTGSSTCARTPGQEALLAVADGGIPENCAAG